MILSARVVEGPRALAAVGPAFDDLCARTGVPVTGRRPWLQAWVDCYAGWDPLVVVVQDERRLVAAAPLARHRFAGLTRVVGLGHGPTDQLHLPAAHPEAAVALAEELVRVLAGCRPWALHVRQLPPASLAVVELLSRLPGAAVRNGEGLPQVHVTDRDPRRYASKNLRKVLTKARRRLEADGLRHEVRWTQDAQQVRALLPRLAEIRRRRDIAVRGRSDHSDPRAARFFQHVLGDHADRGQVLLATLHLDDALAAYSCNLRDGRALRIWDARLDPRFAEYSAGRLLTAAVLDRVVADPGLDVLDWMQGEEPYKLQTATIVVPAVDLVAASSRAVAAGRDGVEALRELKQRSPVLSRVWWAAQDRRRGGSGDADA